MEDGVQPAEPREAAKADVAARLAVIGMSLAAVGLVLLGTAKYGPGLWPDGTNLLWSAKNLLAGHGLLSADGRPMVEWPPLFPALAAVPGMAGVDPWTAVRFINALSFGLIVYLAGTLFLRSFRLRSLSLVGTASILISHPLAAVAVMAWPDTLFNLLVIVFLLLFSRFAAAPRIRTFIPVCVVTAAAGLAHYSGVSVALAGVFATALLLRRLPPVRRFAYATVCGLSGLVPLAVWLARNLRLAGTLAGTRVPVTRVNFMEGILTALREWFFQPRLTRWLGVIGLLVAVALVALLAFIALRRGRGRADRPAWFSRSSVVWLAAFGAFLLVPEPPMNFDPIPDRVMVPAFVVVIYLLISGLDWFASALSRRIGRSRLPELTALGLALLWLSYPLTHVSTVYGNWVDFGTGGYNSDQWRQSPTLEWLRRNPPPAEVPVYSNEPVVLRLLAGIPAGPSPRRNADLAAFRRALEDKPAFLVWFKAEASPTMAQPAELGRVLNLDKRGATFPDAEVYAIRPGPRPEPRQP